MKMGVLVWLDPRCQITIMRRPLGSLHLVALATEELRVTKKEHRYGPQHDGDLQRSIAIEQFSGISP